MSSSKLHWRQQSWRVSWPHCNKTWLPRKGDTKCCRPVCLPPVQDKAWKQHAFMLLHLFTIADIYAFTILRFAGAGRACRAAKSWFRANVVRAAESCAERKIVCLAAATRADAILTKLGSHCVQIASPRHWNLKHMKTAWFSQWRCTVYFERAAPQEPPC